MHASFENGVALVTGASGGIGSEIARHLAAKGFKVAIHYNNNKSAAEKIQKETCFQEYGASIFRANLTNEEAVAALWQDIESELGPVSTLICNAGYLQEQGVPLEEMPLEQWQKTQTNNVLPYFLCMREFFRALKRHPFTHPSAVLVASMSGMWGQPMHCDYAAAKASATYGILPSLKDEIIRLAPQGRVNAVAPGFIKTKMITNILQNEEGMKKVLQTASLRKFGQPKDVAAAVTFLACSEHSGHITGEIIRLAGGKEGRVLFDSDQIEL